MKFSNGIGVRRRERDFGCQHSWNQEGDFGLERSVSTMTSVVDLGKVEFLLHLGQRRVLSAHLGDSCSDGSHNLQDGPSGVLK